MRISKLSLFLLGIIMVTAIIALSGCGSSSPVSSAPPAPAGPAGLTVTGQTNTAGPGTTGSVTLGWNSVQGATAYTIYGSTTQPVVINAANRIASGPGGAGATQSGNITGLPAGTYYAVVTATVGGVETRPSNTVTVTIL